jgi:hypothetical protein
VDQADSRLAPALILVSMGFGSTPVGILTRLSKATVTDQQGMACLGAAKLTQAATAGKVVGEGELRRRVGAVHVLSGLVQGNVQSVVRGGVTRVISKEGLGGGKKRAAGRAPSARKYQKESLAEALPPPPSCPP